LTSVGDSGPRILVLRTSALGDIVHSLPVLRALRRQLPRARIGWVAEAPYVPLLEGHPDLDVLLPVRLRTWRHQLGSAGTWKELQQFYRQLENFAPEITLDLMGNHKAGVLGALSLADRRIGFERSARREPSSAIWLSEPVHPRGTHVVDHMLSLLDALDLPPEPADFGGNLLLNRTPATVSEILEAETGPRVVIVPGAGWDNKRYPTPLWGEVARLLAADPGIPCWVLPGPGEEALAREVVAASQRSARVLSLPGLDGLAAALRRADLVLGGDTGPLHLAQALGRSVLCLMGPTAPERNGPYGEPRRALWHPRPCSFCHQRRDETRPCLHNLHPDEVADRARELLSS
jgi:heptosyltransferase-1